MKNKILPFIDVLKSNKGIVATNTIALFGLCLGLWQLHLSSLPKDTKITIRTSEYKECFGDGRHCNQLFLYNNDEAPCFDFHLYYNKDEFINVSYQKDYEKSRIMDSEVMSNGKLGWPAMLTIFLNERISNDGKSIDLQVLKKNEIAYFAFYPKNPNIEHEIQVTCVDYKQNVTLYPKK